MAAPKGNRFWDARDSHGRDRIFETPEQLWAACCGYFDWVENNPIIEQIVFYDSKKGEVIKDFKEHPRAMTIQGLCLHLRIDPKTWANYEAIEGFFPITTRAREIMFEQKFTGASAGLMNPSIIARELGLTDSKSIKHEGAIENVMFYYPDNGRLTNPDGS